MLDHNETLDALVEAIRFDVDYHIIDKKRKTPPEDGSINKELYRRIDKARERGVTIYPQQMRIRVLNRCGLSATPENHTLFDRAMDNFKWKLRQFNPNVNENA